MQDVATMTLTVASRAIGPVRLCWNMAEAALPWSHGVKNVVEQFVGWAPWNRRTELALPQGGRVVEYPGVYLLAEFGASQPASEVSYLDEAIFYVGETGRALGRRWYDYERSRWFSSAWGKSADAIWIAAFPTWIGDEERTTPEPLTKQFRLYTERCIIWEHVSKGRRLLNVR